MPSRLLVLVCALVASVGCGESRAERILDEQSAECASYRGKTIVEAERAQTDFALLLRCLPGQDSGAPGERLVRFAGDDCDHTQLRLCDLGWCYYSTDPSGCGDFGCWYGCGIRVVPKDADGNGSLDDDTVICGSRFASGQPVPPFCPY
jgi:hypothetical protein